MKFLVKPFMLKKILGACFCLRDCSCDGFLAGCCPFKKGNRITH